jgi:fructose-1,6-bisphosphatase I
VNQGNYYRYSEKVRQFIYTCQVKTRAEGGPYTHRYTGTLVADMHRNLLKGGIFLYPATAHHAHGKLRLVYECNPFAFILEMSGGCATDGQKNILDIQPESLHQRVPFFAGSRDMMQPFMLNAELLTVDR